MARWAASGRKAAAVLAVALGLAGCAGGPPPEAFLPSTAGAPSQAARQIDILVATSRLRNKATGAFGFDRSDAVSYQAVDVSIPPTHAIGKIEWGSAASRDPARNFVTRSFDDIDEAQFRASIQKRLRGRGDVMLFVHGYNTQYHEAVYRLAQIAADSGFAGPPVLFSWPSEGKVTGYLRDRESALYSRDRLERTIRLIAATPGVARVHLLAHSMGNMLTVETLRQAAIRGDVTFGGKLGEVILASPDIDVDVFRTQIVAIGPRRPPITLIVSRDDRALALSQRLAGDVRRVGAATLDDDKDRADMQKYGLTVYDVTEIEGSGVNHNKFASAPLLVGAIGRHLNNYLGDREKEGAGVFVVDSLGLVLGAPKKLLETVAPQ